MSSSEEANGDFLGVFSHAGLCVSHGGTLQTLCREKLHKLEMGLTCLIPCGRYGGMEKTSFSLKQAPCGDLRDLTVGPHMYLHMPSRLMLKVSASLDEQTSAELQVRSGLVQIPTGLWDHFNHAHARPSFVRKLYIPVSSS